MHIASPHYLLYSRYAPLWRKLVTGIGMQWHDADATACLDALQQPAVQRSLQDIPGVNFQLAWLELQQLSNQAEALLVPQLNRIASPRGSGQNPWIASFATMVQTQMPAQRLLPIPAEQLSKDELEPIVTQRLLDLRSNAALVRRSWQRQRSLLGRNANRPEPLWQRADTTSLAVVAQPWLLSDLPLDWSTLLQAHYPSTDYHLIFQNALEPNNLRQQGWAHDPRLLATDAEVLGAARSMARKPMVAGIVFLHDTSQASDRWLARTLSKLTHKPIYSHSLQELSQTEGIESLRYILRQGIVQEGIAQEGIVQTDIPAQAPIAEEAASL